MHVTPNRPVEVFKPTTDDWYPSYHLKDAGRYNALVRVKLLAFPNGTGYRVCVWGMDDEGRERDFGPDGADEALACFLRVLAEPDVSKSFLARLGFARA